MVLKGMLWCLAALGLSLAAFGQTAPASNKLPLAPIPADPLELVAGPIQVAGTASSRDAALQLLGRARANYNLRSAGRGYDLNVSFTVNSGAQTQYDGFWRMEEVFDPQQGLRWTAKAGSDYAVTQISANKTVYGDTTADHIPLRLQEARAVLFDPIPPLPRVALGSIRTSPAIYNGAQVTCVLLSASDDAASAPPGRSWDETEDCIDPQTGLLQVHSQVPGRYAAYQYANGPALAGHVLPRKVIVTEAGKTVSEISVDSLTEVSNADSSLFSPNVQKNAKGQAIAMTGAQKITRVMGKAPFPAGAALQPVCVFGVVTPTGQLVEAHSLQPGDPNSQAAVAAARKLRFSQPTPAEARPRQHFVFVIEEFVSSR